MLVETAVRLLNELKPSAAGATPSTVPSTALVPAATTRPAALTLRDKRRLHLYLIMGQSNMAGRGAVGEEDRTPHPRVDAHCGWRLGAGGRAHHPRSQGRARRRSRPRVRKGHGRARPRCHDRLDPLAVGGTPLARWQKGADLYANDVRRAKLAAEVGTLKGVIWHQGENEAADEARAETYGDRLAGMVRDLRIELGTPELPFVAGQLGEFFYARSGQIAVRADRQRAPSRPCPGRLADTACVPSAGLGHKGDELHFDAAAERELGRRFAAEMLRLQTRPSE